MKPHAGVDVKELPFNATANVKYFLRNHNLPL